MLKTVKKEVPDETYENQEGKKVEIYREQNPVNPREFGTTHGTMVCIHKKYSMGDKQPSRKKFDGWRELKQQIMEENNVLKILPLYLYDHSRLSVSTTPFNSHFDSMKLGFIYTSKEKLDKLGVPEEKRTDKKLEEYLKNEVEAYDKYLKGRVWRYVLKDKESGEHLDSCGGFIGKDLDRMFKTMGEELEEYNKVTA